MHTETRAEQGHIWFKRRSALGLHLLAALTFAGLMFLIGMIPADSMREEIIYTSFGLRAVALIGLYLFRPFNGVLQKIPVPEETGIVMFFALALVYALLITLPLYFFFRTRHHWLLAVQLLALLLHLSFARLVVAPIWIND